MGYNTTYRLSWRAMEGYECECDGRGCCWYHEKRQDTVVGSLDERMAAEITAAVDGMGYMGCALDVSGDCAESCTWYDHETDMIALSLRLKNVLFTLAGVGKDTGDTWRKYFLNGQIQVEKAQITIGEFNPLKLVTRKGPE